ncbi:hypothetical protein ACF1B0_29360 [Streptomyces anandii]|uniref:hypothetical protein n=1 Tax=Streptomyces anandii TaxID=285454 RepID=UPI0036FBB98F
MLPARAGVGGGPSPGRAAHYRLPGGNRRVAEHAAHDGHLPVLDLDDRTAAFGLGSAARSA